MIYAAVIALLAVAPSKCDSDTALIEERVLRTRLDDHVVELLIAISKDRTRRRLPPVAFGLCPSADASVAAMRRDPPTVRALRKAHVDPDALVSAAWTLVMTGEALPRVRHGRFFEANRRIYLKHLREWSAL